MNQRGCITLVFDDGYQKILDEIVPLLNRRHLPAVFAIPLDAGSVSQQTTIPAAGLAAWQKIAAGHELAAHSRTHQDLRRCSDEALDAELKIPAAALPATTLVYPGGAYDNRVLAAARTHYRAARTVERGFETMPPADPFRLKTFDYTRRNFSVWRANWRALYAWAANAWLIETYHLIDDATPITHSVRRADFIRHLDFIQRLPIAVKTITQVVSP